MLEELFDLRAATFCELCLFGRLALVSICWRRKVRRK